jgi:hypothetical protein
MAGHVEQITVLVERELAEVAEKKPSSTQSPPKESFSNPLLFSF